jgi:hypothetical protein
MTGGSLSGMTTRERKRGRVVSFHPEIILEQTETENDSRWGKHRLGVKDREGEGDVGS